MFTEPTTGVTTQGRCTRFRDSSTCSRVSQVELMDTEDGMTFIFELVRVSSAAMCPDITEFSVDLKTDVVAQLAAAGTASEGVMPLGALGAIWDGGVAAVDHVSWAIAPASMQPLGARVRLSFTLKGVERLRDVCTSDDSDVCTFHVLSSSRCWSGTVDSSFL
mmetsp:Transcript_28891/g.63685  ORF Transcript_28891/g.63685 Transcript_28891/m.63685 type:complete len:163 (-) Transcript_28891:466-954(-)